MFEAVDEEEEVKVVSEVDAAFRLVGKQMREVEYEEKERFKWRTLFGGLGYLMC